MRAVPLAKFDKYLANNGLRLTKQRQFIANLFFKQHSHVSAEELYRQVTKKDKNIGLATVYRTLKLLSAAKLANERQFGDGSSRYEPALSDAHHDHLICTACGRIIEFENKKIEALQEEEALKNQFKVSHHKLELYGLCHNCNQEK